MSQEKSSLRGYFFISFPILGFGIAPILIDIALTQIDVYTFIFLRFFVSALFLSPILLMDGYLEKVKRLLGMKRTYLLALFQSIAIIFQYISQLFVIPSFSTIVTKSYLIYVPFITPFIAKEKFQARNVFIAFFGFSGVFLISDLGNLDFTSDLFWGLMAATISSLGFAFYIVYSSLLAQDNDVDNFALLLIVLWFVTFVSGGLLISNTDKLSIHYSQEIILILGILIVFSTLISYFAYFAALEDISAVTGSVLLLLQNIPPFLSDYFLFGRDLSRNFLLGSAILVIASYLSIYFNRRDQ